MIFASYYRATNHKRLLYPCRLRRRDLRLLQRLLLLGLERRPGRALGIYLRLRHDDSLPVSLSPRALLGILLPGLVWLVY